MIFPILVLTVSSFSKMFSPATTSSIQSQGILRLMRLLEEVNSKLFYSILSTPLVSFLNFRLTLYFSISFSSDIFISVKYLSSLATSFLLSSLSSMRAYFSLFLNYFQIHCSFFEGFFCTCTVVSYMWEISMESWMLFFLFLQNLVLK